MRANQFQHKILPTTAIPTALSRSSTKHSKSIHFQLLHYASSTLYSSLHWYGVDLVAIASFLGGHTGGSSAKEFVQDITTPRRSHAPFSPSSGDDHCFHQLSHASTSQQQENSSTKFFHPPFRSCRFSCSSRDEAYVHRIP